MEEESISTLEALLERPIPPSSDYIGATVDGVTYFDPWDIYPFYGNYSSEFDAMALTVLENLLVGMRNKETLAHEMFRELLCNMELCDYGTSPRVCFATSKFQKLLPIYIDKWKAYYKLQWGEDYML